MRSDQLGYPGKSLRRIVGLARTARNCVSGGINEASVRGVSVEKAFPLPSFTADTTAIREQPWQLRTFSGFHPFVCACGEIAECERRCKSSTELLYES